MSRASFSGRLSHSFTCFFVGWLFLGWLLFAAGAGATTPDRTPVLLRKTSLLPPAESVGTGLEPEVRVRVKIDRRGTVEEVEVLSVKPSSELDETFAAHTRGELMTWRYAPAIENGEPVAKTLDWTVKFQVASGSTGHDPGKGRSVPSVLQPSGGVGPWETTRRRELFQAMNPDRQQEILRSYSRIAEKYIVIEDRKQFSSDHFVVVTDFAAEELPRQVAQNLEAAFQTIAAFHQPEIEPYPHNFKTLVYLYSSPDSFRAMRAELSPFTQEWATYYPPGLIVYHLEVTSDALLGFLIHEASHAYSDHHLRRHPLPPWFEEGFAEYMGNSRVKKGRLVPGETLKRRYVLNHASAGARISTTEAGWDLDHVRQAVRSGDAPSLDQLLTTDYQTFYGPDSHLNYGLAWLFVHFLRHGEENWKDDVFPRLVLYLAEGYPARYALESLYGRSVESMEEDFRRHVRKKL